MHITELTGSYLFALMKLMKRPLQAQYSPKTAALYGFLALNVGEEKEKVIWGIEIGPGQSVLVCLRLIGIRDL